MSAKYSIDSIKQLRSRIESTRNKEHIKKIREIIFRNNPNLSTTSNSSGRLLFFHNLTQVTYEELDELFKKIDTERIQSITDSISESNDNIDKLMNDINTKIRLTSSDTKLIKKKQPKTKEIDKN